MATREAAHREGDAGIAEVQHGRVYGHGPRRCMGRRQSAVYSMPNQGTGSAESAEGADVSDTREFNPPFDGKPCPCCPTEVRGLYSTAHNLAARLLGKSDSSNTTAEDLWAALEAMKPFIDAHFADSMHSHGRVTRSARES